MKYRRGEIWWVNLDPTVGKEAKKIRACLIIQNDIGNEESDLTTIVPFLSPKKYPFVVNVKPSTVNQLDQERGLHFNQIRSIDSSRLKSKLGVLEADYFIQIKRALDIQLGFY
ncbi:MAG: type II toxin-antitoxin system PemK/MazF family toxin [Xenococcaceae cyanobacterium MO_234.B1]|nr:type II toxin-antitoxin system PemK/MazF family toxin [Xenococcaceae cyanobacterium MO_234.B1]